MGVHESGEMYLEAIYVLTEKNGFVRSIDISEYLGYSKPSVSIAMKNLREKNHNRSQSNLTQRAQRRTETGRLKHKTHIRTRRVRNKHETDNKTYHANTIHTVIRPHPVYQRGNSSSLTGKLQFSHGRTTILSREHSLSTTVSVLQYRLCGTEIGTGKH